MKSEIRCEIEACFPLGDLQSYLHMMTYYGDTK